jgi:hypothetical protein
MLKLISFARCHYSTFACRENHPEAYGKTPCQGNQGADLIHPLVLKRSSQPITSAIHAARWSKIANDWLMASRDHVTRHDAAVKEGAYRGLCISRPTDAKWRGSMCDITYERTKLHQISESSQENFQVRNLAAILWTVHSSLIVVSTVSLIPN